MASEGKEPQNLNVALIVAIVAGALTLITSTVTSYLSNRGSLEVERVREKAQGELELQKLKTSLILEAVKVGDKQKALDNLTFFIDAGFLDDPQGKIKALLNDNVLPVLPTPKATSLDDDPNWSWVRTLFPEAAAGMAKQDLSAGDASLRKGDKNEALQHYKRALTAAEAYGCGTPVAKVAREKISKLPGSLALEPCVPPPPKEAAKQGTEDPH
jgi:hypothetical protein